MRTGKRRPSISQTSIEAALNSLLYTTKDIVPAQTLFSLAITHAFLKNAACPPAQGLREYAVKAILCTMITETLNRFRAGFELELPSETDTRRRAIEQIEQDSMQNSPDLMAWSILYYIFARVDLGVTQGLYGEYSSLEERTIRRYKRHGIAKLTEEVITAEWRARKEQHVYHLKANIPAHNPGILVGRDQHVQVARKLLQNQPCDPIYVTGVAGIGKTAFVATIVHDLVDMQPPDYLIWLRSPPSIPEAIAALETHIKPSRKSDDLKTILHSHDIIVVIDDIEDMLDAGSALDDLLAPLGGTRCFLTSRLHHPLSTRVSHFHLSELSYEDTHKLVVRQFAGQGRSTEDSESVFQYIWKVAGGNPQAIQLAMNHAQNGTAGYFSGSVLNPLYASLYSNLNGQQRDVWRILALVYPKPILEETLRVFVQIGFFLHEDVVQLNEQFLLTHLPYPNGYTISTSACQFIMQSVRSDLQEAEQVLTLIVGVLGHRHELSNNFINMFAYHVLTNDWIRLSDSLVLELLQAGWQSRMDDMDSEGWLRLFDRHGDLVSVRLDLQVAAGTYARQIGESDVAFKQLDYVATEAGKRGQFVVQAEAELEMAILHRKQGFLQHAMMILQRLHHLPAAYVNIELRRRIRLELAQIQLERGDAEEVLTLLEPIRSASVDDLILRSEALLLLDDIPQCRQVALDCLELIQHKQMMRKMASLQTIIARTFQHDGQIEAAIDWYNAALAISEQYDDAFGMARTQTNLASVLIDFDLGSYQEAELLLKSARKSQEESRDRVGLEATLHNLAILQHKKSQREN